MSKTESESILDSVPRETVNPYLTGVGMIMRRLQWDVRPLSWISRKRVKKWKNRYAGKKAVILCNGPSLNKVDFDRLLQPSVFTFGLNKINLLFDRTDFRPSCIVVVNPLVIEQNRGFFNSTDIPVFVSSNGRRWVKLRKSVCFVHSSKIVGRFARDCSMSIHEGGTVTYVAMQLAFHMGFDQVALVGCDHTFSTRGPANKKVRAGSEDHDHFDPSYFADGVAWHLPDLTGSELHYEIARDIFAHFGRKIVNCTDGGALEVFERSDLSTFLSMQ